MEIISTIPNSPAVTARSEYLSVFKIGLFSNRWMVGATAVSFLLVLAVVYVPFLQPFFYTVALTPGRLAFHAAVLLRLADGHGTEQDSHPAQ